MGCGYLDRDQAAALKQEYEHVLGKLVNIISHPEEWTIRAVREAEVEYDAATR